MKTVLITVAIFASSLISNSHATGTIDMYKKLEEVVKFENGVLPVEKNKSEFVKVSFIVNEEGNIEILEMNYSDELIKTQLIKKLAEMKIEGDYDSEEVYNYNFTFMKM